MPQGIARSVDMTHGPLARKVVMFAIPIALQQVLQQLFNAVDVAMMGQLVSEEAMAAVGSNSPIIFLVVSLFQGVSLGANTVIATAIGKGEPDEASRAAHSAIIIALVGGVLMALLAQVIAPMLLSAMDVPDNVWDMALTYLRIYMAGLPVIFLYDFEGAIFRSQGDSRTPLVALALAGVVHVGINFALVLGLHMTADGVALGTVISNLGSSVYLFVALTRVRGVIHIDVRRLRLDGPTTRRILAIGIPAGLQTSLFSIANIVVQSSVNTLGSTVMAGNSAAGTLENFSYFTFNSVGQACTTFVGQNNGAHRQDRCRKTLRVCLLLGWGSMFVTAGFMLIFSEPLLSIFNTDPAVIAAGQVNLTIILLSYSVSSIGEVLSGYLRGYGLSVLPAATGMVCIVLLRVLWCTVVFPANPSYVLLIMVYPVTLLINTTAIAVIWAVVHNDLGSRYGAAR